MIDLHFWPTPNAKKVTILLEELGAAYRVVVCNIMRGDQFEPDFLRISPNNRMPAIVDDDPAGGGAPVSVFESGAILMYLAEKAGCFWPTDVRGRYAVAEWLIWQMANQGPKLGECGHFMRAPEKAGDQSYAVRRFTDESNRLNGVLDTQLSKSRYLAGDAYTIADMAAYPWTRTPAAAAGEIDSFPHLKRWRDELATRPAVERGMAVGADLQEDWSVLGPEEVRRRMKLLYNQRARPLHAD
jgi:GST-like protein